MAIFKRIPKWGQIASVYAVIVVMIYSWTILWFFWKLPSWLDYLNAGEIALTFAFTLATNFVESLAVLCAPLILCIILPSRWFYETFIARGTALVMLGLGYMMYVAFQFQTKEDYPSLTLKAWTVALAAVIILFLVFLIGRFSLSRRIMEVVADRVTIFLYLFVPLSLVALMVVVARLLF